MPSHFDRFRLLNGGRFRNESEKVVYLRAEEHDPPITVAPGQEIPYPVAPSGETIIEVENTE